MFRSRRSPFCEIRKALNLDEDALIYVELQLSTSEFDVAESDPVNFVLTVKTTNEEDGLQPVARVVGTIYGTYGKKDDLSTIAWIMDDNSADEGVAGSLALHYSETVKGICADKFFPNAVLYVRSVRLMQEGAQPCARGILLQHVGKLYAQCTGTKHFVVTMIFAKDEQDILSSVPDEFVVHGSECSGYIKLVER